MFKGATGRLQVYLLRYGAEVTVTPRPFADFSLVHMSIRGGAEIESDGHRISVAEGRAAVIAPRRSIQLRWTAGTEQLILKIPNELFEEARSSLRRDPLESSSGFVVPRLLTPQWSLMVQALLGTLAMPSEARLGQAWIPHLERSLAMFVLGHQPNQQAAQPTPWISAPGVEEASERLALAGGEQRMNTVLQFMHARLGAPIALPDLARVAGISERTLNALSRRFHGASPMELLRNLRLDAVRAKLLLEPHANITQTSLEYGFGHAGRFAAYYEERFKELPHETLARHKDLP